MAKTFADVAPADEFTYRGLSCTRLYVAMDPDCSNGSVNAFYRVDDTPHYLFIKDDELVNDGGTATVSTPTCQIFQLDDYRKKKR